MTWSVITGYWRCVLCGEALVTSEKVKLGKEGRSVIQTLVWLHDTVTLHNRLAGWQAGSLLGEFSFLCSCVEK
jgi:hypothetical protein